MNTLSLEQSAQDLEKALEICYTNKESAIFKDACIYRFKNTYEITLRMIKRYLKEISSNPFEIEKLTFNQMIRKAFEVSIIKSEFKDWKKFRDCRIKISESYQEEIVDEILKEAPFFLKEVKYLVSRINKELTQEKQ